MKTWQTALALGLLAWVLALLGAVAGLHDLSHPAGLFVRVCMPVALLVGAATKRSTFSFDARASVITLALLVVGYVLAYQSQSVSGIQDHRHIDVCWLWTWVIAVVALYRGAVEYVRIRRLSVSSA